MLDIVCNGGKVGFYLNIPRKSLLIRAYSPNINSLTAERINDKAE